MNEKDGAICAYCGRQAVVYHASKGIHACTLPACERAFEQDTQFEVYGYLKKTPMDGKAGGATGETDLPFVPP